MIRSLSLAPIAFVLLMSTGCRHVAPYERAKLAHPTMGTGTPQGVAEEHMYAVHEGATGGGAAAESGCGCN